MKNPHNKKKVGYSMIVVAGALAIIGILALAIGGDVLYSDTIQRDNTKLFEDCKANDFAGEQCESFVKEIEEMKRNPLT